MTTTWFVRSTHPNATRVHEIRRSWFHAYFGRTVYRARCGNVIVRGEICAGPATCAGCIRADHVCPHCGGRL